MVDYKIVNKYLGENRVLFSNVAKSFVESYKDFGQKASKALNNRDSSLLYREIHSQKGISLNLGLKCLYDQSLKILPLLKDDIIKDNLIVKYVKTLDKAIRELTKLSSSLR